MRQAAKELEFERAAALRDEIQNIRLRVLEQDASVTVARAAERAAATRRRGPGRPDRRRRPGARPAGRRGRRGRRPVMEVMSVTVLPAEEEPSETLDGEPVGAATGPPRTGCPGIRDEHDDDGGWQARWLERPDLGPHRHAEHPQAHRPASEPPALGTS